MLKNYIEHIGRPTTRLYILAATLLILGLIKGVNYYWALAHPGTQPKYQIVNAEQATEISIPEAKTSATNITPTTPSTTTTPAPTISQNQTTTTVLKPSPKTTPTPAPIPKPTYKAPSTYTPPTVNTQPTVTPPATTNPSSFTIATAQNYIEDEILRLVNAHRASKGLSQLYHQPQLRAAADIRVWEEAITSFDGTNHTRPDGRTFDTAFPQAGYTGYTAWGENLAWGYQSTLSLNTTALKALASKMYNNWVNSPGHYAIMISPKYNHTGVGVALVNQGSRTYYFGIQEFARK